MATTQKDGAEMSEEEVVQSVRDTFNPINEKIEADEHVERDDAETWMLYNSVFGAWKIADSSDLTEREAADLLREAADITDDLAPDEEQEAANQG